MLNREKHGCVHKQRRIYSHTLNGPALVGHAGNVMTGCRLSDFNRERARGHTLAHSCINQARNAACPLFKMHGQTPLASLVTRRYDAQNLKISLTPHGVSLGRLAEIFSKEWIFRAFGRITDG